MIEPPDANDSGMESEEPAPDEGAEGATSALTAEEQVAPSLPAGAAQTYEGETTVSADDMAVAAVADEEVASQAPSDADRAAARAELERLFEAASIQRVVFVDNEFEVSIDSVVAALRRLPTERRSNVSFLGDVPFDVPDEDVWIAAVEDRWLDLTPADQAICGSDALARSGVENLRDQPNAGAIGPLLPEGSFDFLSPAQWDEQAETILTDAAVMGTLLLFDRHFEDEDDQGVRELQGVFASAHAGSVRAGILSNSVARDGEVGLWQQLRVDYDLPGDRFVVISKENASAGTLSFPQALKVALLTPHFDTLRTSVATALGTAHTSAMEQLNAINPYLFERLVFAASRREGVWEPDTLLRVASIYTRSEVLSSLRGNDDVHTGVRAARRIAEIATREISATTEAAQVLASQLQHAEIFEPGAYVNEVHMPLELGDVFQKEGGTTRFVLVAQPCDLMVREGGKRGLEPEFLAVVRLVDAVPNLDVDDYFTLRFMNSNGSPRYALLHRAYPVPAEALDLCVYDAEGRSRIHIDGSPPHRLTPHWDKRYERHRNWASQSVEKILAVEAGESRELVRRAVLYCSDRSLAKGKVTDNNKVVKYNFVRVGRIMPPASLGLLSAFLAYQGRMASEGPLG